MSCKKMRCIKAPAEWVFDVKPCDIVIVGEVYTTREAGYVFCDGCEDEGPWCSDEMCELLTAEGTPDMYTLKYNDHSWVDLPAVFFVPALPTIIDVLRKAMETEK